MFLTVDQGIYMIHFKIEIHKFFKKITHFGFDSDFNFKLECVVMFLSTQ